MRHVTTSTYHSKHCTGRFWDLGEDQGTSGRGSVKKGLQRMRLICDP